MADLLTDPSNAANQQILAKIRNRAAEVSLQVSQCNGKEMSKKQIRQLLFAIRNLVKNVTIGWNPRQDATVRKCVKDFKDIVAQAMACDTDNKTTGCLKQCLIEIAQLKVEEPRWVEEVQRNNEATKINWPGASTGDDIKREINREIPQSGNENRYAPSVTKQHAAACKSDSIDSSSSSELESDNEGEEGCEGALKALSGVVDVAPGPGSKEDREEGCEAALKVMLAADDADDVPVGTQVVAENATNPGLTVKYPAQILRSIMNHAINLSRVDQWCIIPDILEVLMASMEEDIGGEQQSKVARCLQIVTSWCPDQREYAGLYRKYAAAVKAYVDRLPTENQNLQSKTAEAVMAMRGDRELVLFLQMIEAVHEQRSFGRKELLLVLVAFKKEIAAGVDGASGKRVVQAIGKISQWLSEDSLNPRQLLLCRMILSALRQFSHRISEPSARNDVERYARLAFTLLIVHQTN
ncbi:unnamed protein product [Phytophthora fragariaefolia]|uniref:Unnamed protein product n=1 Tax=Phytophthora fragariaefolia TaxID=1490495 RepID=A0A9W6X2X8_9STRA|nr:unnamed protein product [Phytophthora fragariaefolia]